MVMKNARAVVAPASDDVIRASSLPSGDLMVGNEAVWAGMQPATNKAAKTCTQWRYRAIASRLPLDGIMIATSAQEVPLESGGSSLHPRSGSRDEPD